MSRLLTIKFTERWRETTCGSCPDYRIRTLGGVRGHLLDGVRRRISWQWHKRTVRHKANRQK
jgi:hypothetical protein